MSRTTSTLRIQSHACPLSIVLPQDEDVLHLKIIAITWQSTLLRNTSSSMVQATSSAARPKRAAEDFARTHDAMSKKPRFDHRNPSTLAADVDDDDGEGGGDAVLDADVIGKSGAQTKRSAVNIDGYESDSDDDNFDSRAAERARQQREEQQQTSRQEEENDMFADVDEENQGTADGDEDEDLAREGKKSKKKVNFVDASELLQVDQKQLDKEDRMIYGNTSGGREATNFEEAGEDGAVHGEAAAGTLEVSYSDSSSGEEDERYELPEEMDEEDAAEIGAGGKRRHAPRIDAFNLKQEEEEGRYDEAGNFVRKANDPDAANDNWLDGLSKKEVRRAKEAQERRDAEQKRKNMEEDAVLTSDLLSTLILHLEAGESPLEALQRLNKGKPKEKKIPLWKQKKLKDSMDVDQNAKANGAASEDPAEVRRKKTLDAITGAADALYSRGQHDIYDTERELLRRQYRRDTGEDWKAPEPEVDSNSEAADGHMPAQSTWEYRWSDARDGGQLHGPYDAAMMKAWNEAGYFGEGVEFRKVGGGEWSRVLDIS